MPPDARPSPDAGQLTGTWTASGLEQPGGTEVRTGSEQILPGWADAGPELADWPDPPAGGEPGFAPGWAGPDNGATPHDAVAADGWASGDAGLRPGAVLGQGEWTVREPGADLEAGPEPAADPGLPPARPPALNLWPGQEAALPAETPASPAAEPPAEGDDPDELPRRVESAFNVWGRRDPAAAPHDGPAASPAGPAPPGTGPAETAAADPAAPLAADPDQPASTPGTRDWVQHTAARMRDADLLPDRDLRPAQPQPAEPVAGRLEPVDDQAEQDPILRPPAPRRRSGPAPGWNPDSEEDWLRVLRGLRASEDS